MRLTIITLTIGSPQYFDEAIGSIEPSGPLDLEHVVVHDGDRAFIDYLAANYPAIKVIRGQGAGATAAAARGVAAATGDFILFLHSDDRLCPGALARFAAAATERTDVKVWSGGARIFGTLPDGREITVRRMADRDSTRLLRNPRDRGHRFRRIAGTVLTIAGSPMRA